MKSRVPVLAGAISDSSLDQQMGPGPENRYGFAGYGLEPGCRETSAALSRRLASAAE